MKIGTFHMDPSGAIIGRIYGLGLGSVPVALDPDVSRDNRKYFRLTAEPGNAPYEVGKAFPKEKNGMAYYSISIDSPVLATPINAALFPNKDNVGIYNLVWNRPEPQGFKAEATVNGSANNGQQRQTPQFAGPKVS